MSVNTVDSNGNLQRVAGGTLYADVPVGTISPFGGSSIPSGYLFCDGGAYSRTEYSELFAAIGTMFGVGDGSTTFNIPDLRETVPVGSGTRGSGVASHDIYNVGEFQDDQLQEHAHEFIPSIGTSRQNKAKGRLYYGDSGNNPGDPYVNDDSEDVYIIGKTTTYEGYGDPRTGTTTHGKQLGVNYIIKAKSIGAPTDIIEGVKDALQYNNILKLVNTINYTKTQNYCHRKTTHGVGMTIPFDELESYSDGSYTARVHAMVARKTNNEDLYFKTFIDIPIAKGTDPNTGLVIKSYGFIPDWSQESKTLPSSDGVYNNGIEVFIQKGTYDGVERDVIGMYYNYSPFDDVNKVVIYMPSAVGFITNSEITSYIEKIQIFKLG